MGRLTNVPAFLPFAWQRSLNGVMMGAVPHALENALGFAFDFADGGDYYSRKRNDLFRQRHPSKCTGSAVQACPFITPCRIVVYTTELYYTQQYIRLGSTFVCDTC